VRMSDTDGEIWGLAQLGEFLPNLGMQGAG
jgi:hypothetical protein